MSSFELNRLHKNGVWQVYRMRDRINLDPPYQRESEVWTKDKKQLLIDTILNEFDVPKIYFHDVSSLVNESSQDFDYSVVDGKQRLSAIWDFMNNKFPLSSDFNFISDDSIDLSGMTYSEIASKYIDIKTSFDSYSLDIIGIATDEIEMIEDLFSRLNEAVPLNAAEKRNALSGELPKIVRKLAKTDFFASKLPFTNKRYRHYDLASKFLMISQRNKIVDTKKAYIDKFFVDHRDITSKKARLLSTNVQSIADSMAEVFTDSDPLLRQVGVVTALFYLFKFASDSDVPLPKRSSIERFEKRRKANKEKAAQDITEADYELLEFDRFAQSPNDPIAMRYRTAVLDKHLLKGQLKLGAILENA